MRTSFYVRATALSVPLTLAIAAAAEARSSWGHAAMILGRAIGF
jgi:hypothetical protein